MLLNIIKKMATKFKYFGVPRANKLDSIEIHSIGTAQDEAEVIAGVMNQYSPGGIVHAICDAKIAGKVVELLPKNNCCWADAGYGNQHSYAIEIAESDQMEYTGGANYRVKNPDIFKADVYRGYNTAVAYVAKKCMEFGFNPLDKLPNGLHRVYSHREGHAAGLSSNHGDPDHIWSRFGLTMDGFRADVVRAMCPEIKPGMKVKLTRAIAIRSGVSTKIKKAGYVKYRQLSASAKKKCKRLAGGKAQLKAGNIVEIKRVIKSQDGNIWIEIKSGCLPVMVKGVWRVTEV